MSLGPREGLQRFSRYICGEEQRRQLEPNAVEMSNTYDIAVLIRRRDGIRDWLDEEAPYTVVDQKHLDAHTPERAYWHYGYQAALTDVIDMLTTAGQKSGSVDT